MDIISICKELLSKHQLGNVKLNLTEEDNYKMFYDIKENEISINEKMLRVEAIDYDFPFEVYVSIIFCHELGHYLDEELESLHKSTGDCFEFLKGNPFNCGEMLVVIENNSAKAEGNAWRIAEELIDESNKENFKLVRNDGLKNSKETLKLENQLMTSRIELTKKEIKLEELRIKHL